MQINLTYVDTYCHDHIWLALIPFAVIFVLNWLAFNAIFAMHNEFTHHREGKQKGSC